MISYYVRLALKSLKRNPGLSLVMIGAVSIGIAACVATLTVYRAMSGNPIWWKGDVLRAVTLTARDAVPKNLPEDATRAFSDLTYRDASYVFRSDIPVRKVMMYWVNGAVRGGSGLPSAIRATTRITTADFFPMFDVPFLYGRGWDAAADNGPMPLIVLSREFNERLFRGVNSVGQSVLWNGRTFRVVGVLDSWYPKPKYYDLNDGPFNAPEDVYLPWGWGISLEQPSSGGQVCPRAVSGFKDLLNSDCLWLQMWVELPTPDSVRRMEGLLDAYWSEQNAAGRFLGHPSPHLLTVPQWLTIHRVVTADNLLLVAVAFAFLAVCLMNTAGLLLAKFLNAAPLAGVRRALGATRCQIIAQYLVEVGLLSAAGALIGLILTWAALSGVRELYAVGRVSSGGYGELARVNTESILLAIVLAFVAALAAGLYPAWRVSRVPPARYLKTQ